MGFNWNWEGLVVSFSSAIKDGVAEGFCVELEHDGKKTSSTPRQKVRMHDPIRLNLPVYDIQL